MWTQYEHLHIYPMIRKEAFGLLEAVASLGSMLAFFGGLSIVSIIQLTANAYLWLMKKMLVVESPDNVRRDIPGLFTKFSSMMRQLKKDFGDFIQMSSIHGVRNLSSSFGSKIFWSAVITTATSACIFFVLRLLETFDQNLVSIQIDGETLSSKEVRETNLIFFNNCVARVLFGRLQNLLFRSHSQQ